MFVVKEMIIYKRITNGIAKMLMRSIRINEIARKTNLTLLFSHFKFLNLRENIGISETSRNDVIKEPIIRNIGFDNILFILE